MNNNNPEFKNIEVNANSNSAVDNKTPEPFFYGEQVGKSWYPPITERFKVLLDSKKIIQQNMGDDLSIDKADVSRIIHGVIIPPHNLRIKIAGYFGVDSSTIWRVEDLPFLKKIMEENKNGN